MVNAIGPWEVVAQRARTRLASIPKANRADHKRVKEALAEAQRELAVTRKQAQRAYEDAGRRWLLSSDGQQWLQSRSLSFP